MNSVILRPGPRAAFMSLLWSRTCLASITYTENPTN